MVLHHLAGKPGQIKGVPMLGEKAFYALPEKKQHRLLLNYLKKLSTHALTRNNDLFQAFIGLDRVNKSEVPWCVSREQR